MSSLNWFFFASMQLQLKNFAWYAYELKWVCSAHAQRYWLCNKLLYACGKQIYFQKTKIFDSMCCWKALFGLDESQKFTFRKNRAPDGSKTRCDPGAIFTGVPSLYHLMLGIGAPSALQFNVTGSWRGTVVSMGCSVIRGICKPVSKAKKNKKWIQISMHREKDFIRRIK